MPTLTTPPPWCSIVPDYLMRRLASSDHPHVAAAAERTLRADAALRTRREQQDRLARRLPGILPQGLRDRAKDAAAPRQTQPAPPQPGAGPATARRSLYTAGHRTSLPGRLVRSEGEPPTDDQSVTEAYDGLGATWSLLLDAYGRDSLDGAGLPLTASVHYDKDYDNAFWDGTQMVFGDGDGVYFDSFTSSIDVIGHELTHKGSPSTPRAWSTSGSPERSTSRSPMSSGPWSSSVPSGRTRRPQTGSSARACSPARSTAWRCAR